MCGRSDCSAGARKCDCTKLLKYLQQFHGALAPTLATSEIVPAHAAFRQRPPELVGRDDSVPYRDVDAEASHRRPPAARLCDAEP